MDDTLVSNGGRWHQLYSRYPSYLSPLRSSQMPIIIPHFSINYKTSSRTPFYNGPISLFHYMTSYAIFKWNNFTGVMMNTLWINIWHLGVICGRWHQAYRRYHILSSKWPQTEPNFTMAQACSTTCRPMTSLNETLFTGEMINISWLVDGWYLGVRCGRWHQSSQIMQMVSLLPPPQYDCHHSPSLI